MAVTNSSGVRLHHVEAGTGDPPLVFIPGWCCDHSFYAPQLEHFSARHRAIAIDPRGCGASDKPTGPYDIPTLADDVVAFCRDAAIERPVLVGHSLGGMVAVDVASRYPSLPSAVVADDPGPLAITPESRARFEALITALEGSDSAAVRREYIARMFLPHDRTHQARVTDAMCSVPLPTALAQLRGVLNWNGMGALCLLTTPTLILLSEPGGDNDASRLLALNPSLQYGVTFGAGHFHQLEVPEQVNAMIDRFLKMLR
ncbi:MAG TPA: alpha/beta hydrolase [Candidatus Dormibacteraeota bacterium]|nr:alpha/beta hydrolase [Candidatus Dormibacteraeota bacterium]